MAEGRDSVIMNPGPGHVAVSAVAPPVSTWTFVCRSTLGLGISAHAKPNKQVLGRTAENELFICTATSNSTQPSNRMFEILFSLMRRLLFRVSHHPLCFLSWALPNHLFEDMASNRQFKRQSTLL